MQKHIVPLLLIGVASAVLGAASVDASDRGATAKKSSQHTRACRKVSVAAMSKTTDTATSAAERESYFNSDFAAQHPSGGG